MNKPKYGELILFKIEKHPTIPYIHGLYLGVAVRSHINDKVYFEIEYPLNIETNTIDYSLANAEWSQLSVFVSVDDLPEWSAYNWLRGVRSFTSELSKHKDNDAYRIVDLSRLRLFSDEYLDKLENNAASEFRRRRIDVRKLSEIRKLYFPTMNKVHKSSELRDFISKE